MGNVFHQLRQRIDSNAKRAVQVYRRELSDYRTLDGDGKQTSMLDFAVILRRRTIALAEDDAPFLDEDLRFMESVGEERGERHVSPASQRQVLVLHTTLTLQELREATGPDDIEDVMRVLRWLGPQGEAAQGAYTRGYLAAQRRSLALSTRVQHLTRLLISDDPAAVESGRSVGMRTSGCQLVMVLRLCGDTRRFTRKVRAQIVDALLKAHRMPMMWTEAAEFVVVAPVDDPTVTVSPEAAAIALPVTRDFAELTDRPCAIGAAVGRERRLAETTMLARQISLVAPAQRKPARLNTLSDNFVELGATQLPAVDDWLRELETRLADGPDLIATLDAFYRNDMNRLKTAADLRIHPRTLAYRLHRARDIAGAHPASPKGVRILTTAVARTLASDRHRPQ
jgi:hypothetical protein